MAKTGLITIHDTVNYGSLLQTFALYKAIEKLGVDIELIDYKCKAIAERETTYAPKEWKSWKDVIRFFLFHKACKRKKENYIKFLRTNMKMSPQYDVSNIKNANTRYDTFIVGSDIVWGMKITGHDFSYMLDFAGDEKRKLAFSASVGEKWGDNEESKVKSLLSRFNMISVREHLASEWISPLINKKIPVTCDPTMLWNNSFWDNYIDNRILPKEKFVLAYMSAENKQTILKSATIIQYTIKGRFMSR